MDSFLYREWDRLLVTAVAPKSVGKNTLFGAFATPALGRLWAKKKLPNMDSFLYREWESNPHALKDTWPSTMPVYQFQHLGVPTVFALDNA